LFLLLAELGDAGNFVLILLLLLVRPVALLLYGFGRFFLFLVYS